MLDGGFVHVGPAQPSLLDDIFGFGARARHAIGQRAQSTSVVPVVAVGAGSGRSVDGVCHGGDIHVCIVHHPRKTNQTAGL